MTLLRWRLVAFLATYLALYHLYIGIFGSPTNRVFLPVHLCLSHGDRKVPQVGL